MIQSIQQQWFSNIRGDVLAGLVVALALIPEAIAFSIIAGVDPKIGLYASFSMAVVIAFTGGRPAMISAATAATALLMITLVKDHGLQYLLATTILAGILQILAGYLKLGSLMRFVSRSVVLGFVNALAILIFLAQLPHLINVTWYVYALVAAGLGIIYLFPYIPVIGKLLPSPLICIVALTIFNVLAGWHVSNVGDMGQLPDTLPFFLIPDIPLTFETLQIIFPYAMSIAAVGLLESLMIATIIDDMTDTESDKNRECKGQGTANIVTGFLGGMAGCAMIGQSVINVKSGGYTRLSTFLAGFFLLIMVVFLGDLIGIIPMAALVAVMIMVSISTFNWQSITKMREYPLSSNLVMLATVAIVVYTHNLALGVLIGVLMAALFFAHKIAHFMVVNVQQEQTDDLTHYQVIGQVFFASANKFTEAFDLQKTTPRVHIDVSHAHFWDVTAIAALDKVVFKLRKLGAEVEVVGLTQASATMVDRFGQHQKVDQMDILSH
jgi:SulP family sulfate permease